MPPPRSSSTSNASPTGDPRDVLPPVPSLASTSIDTPRLVLRPAREADVPALYRALRKNADHLRPWSPAPPPEERRPTLTTAAREVARWRALWKRGESFALYAFARAAEESAANELVGRVTLGRVTRGVFQNAYLGYWMDATRQGQGLMTEAVRAALGFAFGPLGLHRVQAAVMPRNARSIRVVEKLGLRREGFAERYLQIAGVWEDHVLFAVTAEEWKVHATSPAP